MRPTFKRCAVRACTFAIATWLASSLAYAQTVSVASRDEAVAAIREAHAQGRNVDVVLLADRALKGSTARGEVHFWRGAALRRLDRLDEALIAIDAAEETGFAQAELYLERALALSALGRTQEGERSMEEARRFLQDADRRRDLEARWANRASGSKRVDVSLRPQFGYDTNLVTIQDDAALIESSDRESFFYGSVLNAKARLLESRSHALDIEYQGAVRAYASETDLSSADNVMSLVARSPLSSRLDVEIRLAYGEVVLSDEGHFRTERSVLPGLTYRPFERWQFRAGIEWSDADYYDAAPAEQDRDGLRQGVRLEATWEAAQGWTFSPFMGLRDINAEGSDYEGTEQELGLRISAPETLHVLTSLAVGVIRAPFDHPHSLTGFTEERKDRRTFVSLAMAFPTLEAAAGFVPSVTIRFEDWHSNIAEFDFTRWEPRVEFAINLPF